MCDVMSTGCPRGYFFRENRLFSREPSRFFGCSAREGWRQSSVVDELPPSLPSTGLAPLAPCIHGAYHQQT